MENFGVSLDYPNRQCCLAKYLDNGRHFCLKMPIPGRNSRVSSLLWLFHLELDCYF